MLRALEELAADRLVAITVTEVNPHNAAAHEGLLDRVTASLADAIGPFDQRPPDRSPGSANRSDNLGVRPTWRIRDDRYPDRDDHLWAAARHSPPLRRDGARLIDGPETGAQWIAGGDCAFYEALGMACGRRHVVAERQSRG
jgi:hypothetical protein